MRREEKMKMKKKIMTSFIKKQINELVGYEAAEIADEFLEKLGIYVCLENDSEEGEVLNPYFPSRHHYELRDRHGSEVVWCYNAADMVFSKFATGNGLLEYVFSNITSFVFPESGRRIENPFLGCRSLEEAKIRMDLAGEDGNA